MMERPRQRRSDWPLRRAARWLSPLLLVLLTGFVQFTVLQADREATRLYWSRYIGEMK